MAEPIASGRFDTKMAINSDRLTPWPSAMPMPSTACSGMPSSSAPNSNGSPDALAAARRSIARSAAIEHDRTGGKPKCHRNRAREPETRLGQFE